MTQLIVERMAALDGPATVDEITDAVAGAAHVPWNYIHQCYQQYLCQAHRSPGVTIKGSVVTPEPSDLGWVAPGYDPSDPAHRRRAIRYVIAKRIGLHTLGQTSMGKRRAWAIRDEDGRVRLNPDESQMPRIREMNGEVVTFDAATRAEIDAGKAAQVAAITRNSDRRTFDLLSPAGQATLLRWLTDQLDVDRVAAQYARRMLDDWKRRGFDHAAALDKLRNLLCREDVAS
jgi:hypothetical protein